MKVTFWGTRGSLAVAGPETVRYGGNTSCVALEADGAPLIVLDAGSGIRALSGAVGDDVTSVHILISHLHMDHIQGLGFFEPLFRPGLDVHVWGPPSVTMSLRQRLTRYLSPPLFPVALRDLPSRLTLHDAPTEKPIQVGPLTVSANLVIHPGPTVGYRITDGRAVVAYLPDHEPVLGADRLSPQTQWVSGAALAWRADLLIHDAQYTEAEYADRVGWGHSTLAHAVALAEMTGVGRLAAFHHDPSRDDAALDAQLELAASATAIPLIGAREGTAVSVP